MQVKEMYMYVIEFERTMGAKVEKGLIMDVVVTDSLEEEMENAERSAEFMMPATAGWARKGSSARIIPRETIEKAAIEILGLDIGADQDVGEAG